ncbi:cobalamin biosynthesis protein CobW [Geothrix limicola]|uniref:Cobalamin biosynthesis protein CobW n=1 Tax=Geothrix limicola TaxID=2927978 RepID=A0ABQ5QBA5_9BACT|nr:GTP-binding protein [Geothrix limicola]GLH71824.1 cobalamin biosynthesis protein CobW [Geothrix limicola]
MDGPAPLDILIVTGPLGAGKTTVVNRLLKAEVAASRRVAVLINEFGAVSVDGTLVDTERPELAGVENLVNGCVCCSLRDDVITTLKAWCDQPEAQRPQRVVLETTGLADPTDLLDLEQEPALAGRLRLAGLLTVISCLAPVDHLKTKPLLHRQAALASLIHLSKADLDPSGAVAWESELHAAFRHIPLVATRQGVAPEGSPDPWLGDVRPLPEGWEASDSTSFAEARSLSLHWDHPVDPAALEALLLASPTQGELLRAKGVCAFAGWAARNDGSDRWAFQLADGRLEISPLPLLADGTAAACVAVAIGTNLDHTQWKKDLRGLEVAPEGARRKVTLRN